MPTNQLLELLHLLPAVQGTLSTFTVIWVGERGGWVGSRDISVLPRCTTTMATAAATAAGAATGATTTTTTRVHPPVAMKDARARLEHHRVQQPLAKGSPTLPFLEGGEGVLDGLHDGMPVPALGKVVGELVAL